MSGVGPGVVSSLWSKLSDINYHNLFSDSDSLTRTKSSNFTLDTTAHFSNSSTSKYGTENPTECNTSTRSRDRDTFWTNSPITKRSGDKYCSFLQNCINACATAFFWSSFFLSAVSVRDLEYFIVRKFCGKKISRISRIGPSSAKLNSREKCFSPSFAKLNSREKKPFLRSRN